MNLLHRFARAYVAVMEPVWDAICTVLGVRWLNQRLTLRRDRRLLELAADLRCAGLGQRADEFEQVVVARRTS